MIKKHIKNLLVKIKLFPEPYLPQNNLLTETAQVCSIKSFGNRNIDKIFYVIRQEGRGRGLFSIVASVLCHLDIAEEHGWIPIIDFQNFPNIYNETKPINDSMNSWEYYFEPVSEYKLDEVYLSRNVIFSDNGYPTGYDYSITTEKKLYTVFYKHLKVKQDIVQEIDSFYRMHLEGNRVLGVHFRGQEMKTAAGHPFPPTKSQMAARIEKLVNDYKFQKVFVVSEDSEYVDFLQGKFRSIFITTDHYRTHGENAYMQYPRENHIYNLGREILVDAYLLSRCQGLIGCGSNVSTFSRFCNNDKFDVDERIDNGTNSSNFVVGQFLWSIKSMLPSYFGGFKL